MTGWMCTIDLYSDEIIFSCLIYYSFDKCSKNFIFFLAAIEY